VARRPENGLDLSSEEKMLEKRPQYNLFFAVSALFWHFPQQVSDSLRSQTLLLLNHILFVFNFN
jgi:hypothetical protein